jgi:hypothetical protein
VQNRVDSPEVRQPADEASGARELGSVLARRNDRQDACQRSREAPDVCGNPLGERRVPRRVQRRSRVLRITQLDRFDVPRTGFGVDNEYPSPWIALALCREERGGQLHLAGARLRVID